MRSFVYEAQPVRVVFGSAGQVREEVERLGASRVLLLARPRWAPIPREALGPLLATEFDGAAMHTPIEVTEQALEILREHDADCVVAIGGGSTTGLSKALAARTGVPQVILPTTYAGSEVTPVLGETSNGRKTTRSSPDILPETVLYDVNLTLGLPVPVTVASAINAMAHAVEALYAPQANPVVDGMALEAIARIGRALPAVVRAPSDVDARADLLQAAWLSGTCLAAVEMGLHHKLCHILGGSFGLPHAETHAVVLPHVMAHQTADARIAGALGATDAPSAVYDLVVAGGGPTSLRELGLAEQDIPRAAEIAGGWEELLREAWEGARPGGGRAIPDVSWLTAQVVASFDGTPDPRVKQLINDLVRHLHQYVRANDVTQAEWQYAIDFLTRTGHLSGDERQEFVLLSDVLGVSSAVDVLTNSRTPGTTPSAVLGPFYVEGPPVAEQGADIAGGLPGTPLWTDVRITDTSGNPVDGAIVDVWQANEDGYYDVQLPGIDGPVLRARFHSDDDGHVRFWSILPSEYPIPDDGPVGKMLAATGRHPWRAPHVHFLIVKPGYSQLITQLFVRGGQYLETSTGQGDTVFGVKNELVVDFLPQQGPTPDGRVVDGEWRLLEFTFRISPVP